MHAGAQMLQVFDSHAGELTPEAFAEFGLPYLQQICKRVRVGMIIQVTYVKLCSGLFRCLFINMLIDQNYFVFSFIRRCMFYVVMLVVFYYNLCCAVACAFKYFAALQVPRSPSALHAPVMLPYVPMTVFAKGMFHCVCICHSLVLIFPPVIRHPLCHGGFVFVGV